MIRLVKIVLLSVVLFTVAVTVIVTVVLHFKGANSPSTMSTSGMSIACRCEWWHFLPFFVQMKLHRWWWEQKPARVFITSQVDENPFHDRARNRIFVFQSKRYNEDIQHRSCLFSSSTRRAGPQTNELPMDSQKHQCTWSSWRLLQQPIRVLSNTQDHCEHRWQRHLSIPQPSGYISISLHQYFRPDFLRLEYVALQRWWCQGATVLVIGATTDDDRLYPSGNTIFSNAHQSIFHDCTRSSGGQHAVDKCHKSVLTCYSGMGAADESTQIRMCEIHAALFFPSHIASPEPPLTRFGLFY